MRKISWNNKFLMIALGIVLGIASFSLASASSATSAAANPAAGVFSHPQTGFFSGTSSWQYSEPAFTTYYSSDEISTYWPILRNIENDQCDATSDFLIMIHPGGCTPEVVRSDLLEEQNVPVFCQLDAVRVNPLIKVSSIKSISFKGEYADAVAGISFHPARAAIRSYQTLLGSPLLNNIGYVVIVLKRNPVESKMPDFVSGNLTATIYYDAEQAYGTGQAQYYLPITSDDKWKSDYAGYGFWYGKGFLRARDIQEGVASIAVYTDENNVFREIKLKEGETSSLMYFPGFYCRAGLKVRLDKIVAPENQAKLNIDGQTIWVRERSEILNSRCRVRKLVAMSEGAGSIEISCPGQTISLILNKLGAQISVAGSLNDYSIGSKIREGNVKVNGNDKGKRSVYLAYVGKKPGNLDAGGENFAVVAISSSDISDSDLINIASQVDSVSKSSEKYNENNFANEIGKAFGALKTSKEVAILVEGGGNLFIDDKQVKFEAGAKAKEAGSDGAVNYYFDNANATVRRLVNEYGTEGGEIENYGEQALLDLARLAESLERFETARNLYSLFISKYPNSVDINGARADLARVSGSDFSKAYSTVFIDNKYYNIRVDDFKQAENTKKRAKISAGSFDNWVNEGEEIGLGRDVKDTKANDYIVVRKISPTDVEIDYYEYNTNSKKHTKSRTMSLRETGSENVNKNEIVVRQIDVEKEAQVTLMPEIKNTGTDANFTFKIGIEKRAIKLSPEKTKEMIKNLNDTIERWESITEKLGNVIKAWKGACFATSTMLTLKNFGNILSGNADESMARQRVMKQYKQVCDSQYSQISRTECYNKLESDIEKDVSAVQKAIKEVNANIESSEKNNVKDKGWFGLESVVDTEKAFAQYKESFKSKYGDKVEIDYNGQKVNVNVDSITSFTQLRESELMMKVKSSGASKYVQNEVQQSVNENLAVIYQTQEAVKKQKEIEEKMKKSLQLPANVLVRGQKEILYDSKGEVTVEQLYDSSTGWEGKIDKALKNYNVDDKVSAQIVAVDTKSYLVLSDVAKKQGSVKQLGVFEINILQDGRMDIVNQVANIPEAKGVSIVSINGGECSYKYLNPKIQFYETSPDINLPALVPFDTTNGWYVKVPQAIGGVFSSQVSGYKASGDVSFFYICNVGSNGREENMKGDDICQSFDVNNYDKVDKFLGCPGLGSSKIQELARKARQAIRDAASQFGSKQIKISGVDGLIQVNAPMNANGELLECQDFMSVSDCKILFNVCDPVICPSSRCNLGGKWSVANVVQTGIIGSLVLCLPNAKEGVIVPICLTGIHAGLDSFVDILKAERDCLQKSLDSGEHVGICDEITSIYLCDFFWNQFAPVIDVLIPKIIETAYGLQGARGGGEYLSVMTAWNNMQKSIDYFKNTYAQNTFRAFQYKNVQEAGTEFCKMFLGTSVPTSAKLLDSLLEPESPEQFYAWFSETLYTEATVPSTSQYKVYYHIYAGNDKGVYYSVYLKDPPATSYYSVNPIVNIKTGYIAKGEHADEAVDFTAPSGYKQLCVRIDAQEKCGFKSVSTDFGLDYLKDQYVKEVAYQRDIISEKDCVSGTPSIYSAVNPNIQAGVENVINPQIAMSGIVRICATANPAANIKYSETGIVQNYSRWVDVGYCDNPNIRCWLDTESVKRQVEQANAINAGLSAASKNISSIDNEFVLTEEDSKKELQLLRDKIKALETELTPSVLEAGIEGINPVIGESGEAWHGDIIIRLNKLIGDSSDGKGRAYSNNNIAEALRLKAGVYMLVIEKLKNFHGIGYSKVTGAIGNEAISSENVCVAKSGEEDGRIINCSDKNEALVGVTAFDNYYRKWVLLNGNNQFINPPEKIVISATSKFTSSPEVYVSISKKNNGEKYKNVGDKRETIFTRENGRWYGEFEFGEIFAGNYQGEWRIIVSCTNCKTKDLATGEFVSKTFNIKIGEESSGSLSNDQDKISAEKDL